MVKGCQKKVICIKDTGSEMFEEAFFIMKPSKDGVRKENDMIREARRILENSRVQPGRIQYREKNNKNSKMMIFSFLFGVLSAAAACAVITAFVNLL